MKILSLASVLILVLSNHAVWGDETNAPIGPVKVQGRLERHGNFIQGRGEMRKGLRVSSGFEVNGAVFVQMGGTNKVKGDLLLTPMWMDGTAYELRGGRLVTSNTIVRTTLKGGFTQNGGVHVVRQKLSVMKNLSEWPLDYVFGGGELIVKDISLGEDAHFAHGRRGELTHRGVLNIAGGHWHAAPRAQQFGPLRLLNAGTNSSFWMPPRAPATMRFADSTEMLWDSDAPLIIYNWQGTTNGMRLHQIYFGTDRSGLTSEQLAQIRFRNPVTAPPGDYPARMRPTGEVIPTSPQSPLNP
jgi:hypothetical protein